MTIQLCLLPKIQELNDKLFSLKDADLTRETILSVLYYKAIIYFHPFGIMAIEEDNRAIQFMKTYGSVLGQKEVCKLLSLLNESS